MSLAAFPQPSAAASPARAPRKTRFPPPAAGLGALDPQLRPQRKPLLESDFRGFPQIHSPSLQFKRYLFPLRNE